MTRWTLRTAKNRFSELVDRARKEGPQLVTRRGADAVVVLSIEDYRAMTKPAVSDLPEFFQKSPLRGLPEDLFARGREKAREVEA